MSKRGIVFIVLGIIIIALGALGFNQLKNMKETPEKSIAAAGAPQVHVIKVKNDQIGSAVPVTGKLVASWKMQLISEVQGKLLNGTKRFDEGVKFSKGETLLRIDNTEARNGLIAQRSGFMSLVTSMLADLKLDYPDNYTAWEQYVGTFDATQALPELPETKSNKEKLFVTSRNIYNQFYNIKSTESRLAKYTINAPFTGVVSMANIDPGTTVVPGQVLGELSDVSSFELEASVTVSQVEFLSIGDIVDLKSEDTKREYVGTIKRISERIDAATQTVRIFVALSDPDLKDGMYLAGGIKAKDISEAVIVPRKLLLGDSKVGANQLYIIDKDSLLQLADVQVVKIQGDQVILKGLSNDLQIMNQRVTGAHVGMKVSPLNGNK